MSLREESGVALAMLASSSRPANPTCPVSQGDTADGAFTLQFTTQVIGAEVINNCYRVAPSRFGATWGSGR